MIKFTKSSSFYSVPVYELNLPAGHTCPNAVECKCTSDRNTGKQTNGEGQKFKCYAAVAERFPAVRENRWNNFEEIKRCKTAIEIAMLIEGVIPKKATHIRIHGGGDFFSQRYFDAWLLVAKERPDITFWTFTKSINFWLARKDQMPKNLTLQASYGGRLDNLIELHKLKYAKVVPSIADAKVMGLPIDFDDTLAMGGTKSFCLLDNYKADAKAERKKRNEVR